MSKVINNPLYGYKSGMTDILKIDGSGIKYRVPNGANLSPPVVVSVHDFLKFVARLI
jgi:hypothetical protein